MNEIRTTLQPRTLPDGCRAIDTAPVLAAALPFIGTPAQRVKFPRFTVIVDSVHHHFERSDAFCRFLGDIVVGSTCRIYRNMGKGVTLNFDEL